MANAAPPATERTRVALSDAAGPPWQTLREAFHLFKQRWSDELGRLDTGFFAEYGALDLCAKAPVRVSEIARAVGLTPAGATDALDRLEARGLVRREDDPADRRAVLIRATPAGLRLHREGKVALQAIVRHLNDSMTLDERRALDVGLAALSRALLDKSPGVPREVRL